jgi:hypothetical protein
MYGHRARIGYCSPPFVTEVFPYEFYKIVPAGVTLMITTLEVGNQYTRQAFDGSHERSLAAARAMADAGADVVILGGNPVNQSLGIANLPTICADLAAEIGTPVIASALAQKEAMERLGPGAWRPRTCPAATMTSVSTGRSAPWDSSPSGYSLRGRTSSSILAGSPRISRSSWLAS